MRMVVGFLTTNWPKVAAMWNESLQADYESLLVGTAVAPLDDHFVISLAGEDRHAFLHNFCTADIKKLAVGDGCEAFVLNGKGKTMAFVHALAFDDAIWLLGADVTSAKPLMEHLDRYIIREDVQLADLSESIRMFFGPSEKVAGLIGIKELLPNKCRVSGEIVDSLRAVSIEVAGVGLWLAVQQDSADELIGKLDALRVTVASAVSLESIRIEQGTPRSGTEADESNLPQELQRDEKAISFTKGCYLGQETVARLDALGRVNQLLTRVQLGAESPEAGAELKADDKVVGRVTSVAWSPKFNQWIGFAFVRRAQASTGTVLQVAGGGTATVC
jgi:folate-binding protein YgfZ